MFVASSIKYADQWEKAVVLRMGKYRGLRGPGMFFMIPIIERISYHIDQRLRTTDFGAESCLTKDTVPVNVDAIAFWIVYDAERAALEVQQYELAVVLAAQTGILGKMMSNVQEVRARGGRIIAIARAGDRRLSELAERTVFVPATLDPLVPVLAVVPLQLLAYHVAVLRGCNVDRPRNLAKSVTVE